MADAEHVAVRVTVTVSLREARLVREAGETNVRSYEIPLERADRQPWEWHEGKELLALAKRLNAAIGRARARAG